MRRYCLTRFILLTNVFPAFLTGLALCMVFCMPVPEAYAEAMGEACADCHDRAEVFDQTFHGRAWQGMNLEATCQNCHGPTDMHVNDPSTENIFSFTKKGGRKADEMDRKCLACHITTAVARFWDISLHKENDVACSTCHTIHTPKASLDQLMVCFTCHKSKRGQITKRSRHPLVEGKIKCSDCHDPHGTEASRHMIRAENVNQLCYKCHPDKRGPYVFEHPPVAENCANCHAPHGSRHAKLLKEKVPNLCQDCHIWSRHPGTPYDASSAFTGSNPSNRFFGRSCLNCHGAIHGSSDLGDHALTR